MKQRAREIARGPTAIELVEEAVHLLRRAPPGTWFVYYAGTAPFALGVVFFWAKTTWFHSSAVAVAWSALGLVLLFALMKAAHAIFCSRLHAQRMRADPPGTSLGRLGQLAAAQLRIQAWGLVLLPLSLAAGAPFGWVFAYFQSAAVLGEGPTLAGNAREQALLWPAQNHIGQLMLSVTFVTVWLNVGVAFWFVPWLANRVLGMENLFGFSGWWIVNTTFLASTAMISWLLVDPLIKAFFTLRVFYGRSRRTGEDLRVELTLARPMRRTMSPAVLVMAALLSIFVGPERLHAAESAPAVQTVDPARLDRAIDHVLEGGDFRWRLRPIPGAEDVAAATNEGPLRRFLRASVKGVREFIRWIIDALSDIRDWLRGVFHGQDRADARNGEAAGIATLELLMWIFVVVVAGLLLSVGVLAMRRRRLYKRPSMLARAVTPTAIPDLQDESTQAAQLPMEGWLVLAREQLERGEWRLAWRALYLATLARLAAQGFVSLAKSKTNLDYERELRRRAIARQEIVSWFSSRRGGFEAVWYGRAAVEETSAREWLAELERPSP